MPIPSQQQTQQTIKLDRTSAVWARYLTTWFVVDALSLFPWERLFVKPIIERQNRRNFVTKFFFRSKGVVKVTRILRGRHFRLFGRVAKRTKSIGVGGQRLLRLIIKYLPKYILFYRNMKGVLILKTLRQIHFTRKVTRGLYGANNAGNVPRNSVNNGNASNVVGNGDVDGIDAGATVVNAVDTSTTTTTVTAAGGGCGSHTIDCVDDITKNEIHGNQYDDDEESCYSMEENDHDDNYDPMDDDEYSCHRDTTTSTLSTIYNNCKELQNDDDDAAATATTMMTPSSSVGTICSMEKFWMLQS